MPTLWPSPGSWSIAKGSSPASPAGRPSPSPSESRARWNVVTSWCYWPMVAGSTSRRASTAHPRMTRPRGFAAGTCGSGGALRVVQVLRSVYDAMVAHALTTPTLECCGLLSGKNGTITRLFQTPNVAENKAVRYEAAPLGVRGLLEGIDGAGEQPLGIYRSSRNSPAYPSATDRKLAGYDVAYIVI